MQSSQVLPSPAQPHRLSSQRRRPAVLLAGVIFVLLVLAGLWRWRARAMPVVLDFDGQTLLVRTTASSPAALLHRLGYPLRSQDKVILSDGWRAHTHIIIQRARPVQLRADGRTRTIWTRAQTVGAALAAAQLALGPADIILWQNQRLSPADRLPPVRWEPPAGRRQAPPWEQQPRPLILSIQRAVPVQIIEDNGLRYSAWTRAATVAAALAEQQIPVYDGDEVLPGLEPPIQPGMQIWLRRATPITILVDGKKIETRTHQKTVADALRALGVMVTGEDRVQPSLAAVLHPHSVIKITRITEKLVYEEELLPFETVWEPDDTLLIDTRRVGSEGHAGVLRRRYRVRYVDGQETARTLEDEWVAVAPERKVILYGRKIIPRTAMTPDGPITYWRKLRAYTTSYSPKRSGTDPSLPWYGHTRLGFTAGKGVVGVDPAVVNMSQKLYVPGYGFAIAGDTGSGLHGKHLDLGFSDDNYESWHWWSDVYLLWPPPPPYAINYVLPDWPRYKGSANPYAGLVQESP